MSRHELTGRRDLAYSRWHRTLDDHLTYVDVDCCEYCARCYTPLALVETAKDYGQAVKPAYVTANLAERAGIPAFVVLYAVLGDEVVGLRVRRIVPKPPTAFRPFTPDEWAQYLRSLRRCHPMEAAA